MPKPAALAAAAVPRLIRKSILCPRNDSRVDREYDVSMSDEAWEASRPVPHHPMWARRGGPGGSSEDQETTADPVSIRTTRPRSRDPSGEDAADRRASSAYLPPEVRNGWARFVRPGRTRRGHLAAVPCRPGTARCRPVRCRAGGRPGRGQEEYDAASSRARLRSTQVRGVQGRFDGRGACLVPNARRCPATRGRSGCPAAGSHRRALGWRWLGRAGACRPSWRRR